MAVPRPHQHTNHGTAPARMLVEMVPAGLEQFFREAGVALRDGADAASSTEPEAVQRVLMGAPQFRMEIGVVQYGAR